jgi:hypothetical protein
MIAMKNIVIISILFLVSKVSLSNDGHPCFKNISQATCLIEKEYQQNYDVPFYEDLANEMKQECLTESSKYAKKLEKIFNDLPEHPKNAFCDIRKIFIVPGEVDYGGGAKQLYRASPSSFNSDMLNIETDGYLLYLSKDYRFDNNESEEEYATRILKSNLNNNEDINTLQVVRTGTNKKYSSLYITIIHEIGHFIDFKNSITGQTYYDVESNTDVIDSFWDKLSWELEENKEDGRLVHIPRIEHSIDSGDWYQQLVSFRDSDFISFYAMSDPREDFAEQYLEYHLEGHKEVLLNGELIFSYKDRPSSILKKKAQIIQDILDKNF